MGAQAIRLMIVDDAAAARDGLSMFFGAQPDLVIVAETCCGEAALELATLLRPDVVLIDIDMSGANALDTMRDLHCIEPRIPVIVLSIHGDKFTRAGAERVGAAAFVTKFMPPQTLLTVIRQAAGRQANAPQTYFR
jgi:DNA-binding NarL/FixJ family response regulator